MFLSMQNLQRDASEVARAQLFDIEELRIGLQKLALNKCGDEYNTVAEKDKYWSNTLRDCILCCFSEMLSTSSFPQD